MDRTLYLVIDLVAVLMLAYVVMIIAVTLI